MSFASLGTAQAWLSSSFGWYYRVVIAAYLNVVLLFSPTLHLHNGSQDDDLMGFTQDQITRDVLDQFESHQQLVGRVYG
ncbi:hypothetical protein [Pseudomonas sp.]|uniref:hypothetical protein n=1 Tax=Pseudomonas sp. TaxID=306 RepID=UPI00258F9D18|nr:hypothetical protein [Pseudomonas sp.]